MTLNNLWKDIKEKYQGKQASNLANLQLQRDIRDALAADGCIILTSRLNKSEEEGGDRLTHTFYFGQGFKFGDMSTSLEAHKSWARDYLSKNSPSMVSPVQEERYVVEEGEVEKINQENKQEITTVNK